LRNYGRTRLECLLNYWVRSSLRGPPAACILFGRARFHPEPSSLSCCASGLPTPPVLCEWSPDPAQTTDRRSHAIFFTSLTSRPSVQKSSLPFRRNPTTKFGAKVRSSSTDFESHHSFLVSRAAKALGRFIVFRSAVITRPRNLLSKFDQVRLTSTIPRNS
jgi:hypothetical protein